MNTSKTKNDYVKVVGEIMMNSSFNFIWGYLIYYVYNKFNL